MYIKFFFLLCFKLYYIPTANSIEEKEIQILWNALIGYIGYISYENLCSIYEDEDPNELWDVIVKYGTKIEHTDCDEEYRRNLESFASNSRIQKWFEQFLVEDDYRIYFENFTKAVSDGRIQRWSKQAMNNAFNEIIPKGEIRNYVTRHDMISHYGYNCVSQIENVMNDYGKVHNGEYRLYFFEFRIAMNIGHLPTPVCDVNASLAELYNEFCKIIPKCKFNCQITHKDLIAYYEPELKNIIAEYGKWHYSEYVLYFENLRNAIISGRLPVLLCGDFSLTEMQSIFNKIISENKAVDYITYNDLVKYNEQQLEDIISIYGEWHYGIPKLNFFNFKKAVNSGDLPISISSKNKIQCSCQ